MFIVKCYKTRNIKKSIRNMDRKVSSQVFHLKIPADKYYKANTVYNICDKISNTSFQKSRVRNYDEMSKILNQRFSGNHKIKNVFFLH